MQPSHYNTKGKPNPTILPSWGPGSGEKVLENKTRGGKVGARTRGSSFFWGGEVGKGDVGGGPPPLHPSFPLSPPHPLSALAPIPPIPFAKKRKCWPSPLPSLFLPN
eukprot:Sspe_Gene.91998::Locus_63669_Transcript_1_3_Confidence_0.444_Length_700::g.91998::m.91998